MKRCARANGAVLRFLTRGPRTHIRRSSLFQHTPFLLMDCRVKPGNDKEEWALEMRAIKTIELLVPVSSMRCRTYTPGLSTWWSTTALKGELVSRWVSRLDAFSDYPVRT